MRNQPLIPNKAAGILLLISSVLLLGGAALRLLGTDRQTSPLITVLLIAISAGFGWLGYLKTKE